MGSRKKKRINKLVCVDLEMVLYVTFNRADSSYGNVGSGGYYTRCTHNIGGD